MDTLTHALSGALLARATASSKQPTGQLRVGERVLLGALAATFPDSDFILRWTTDLLTYLNLHRGITHSVVMLPIWGALLATLFWRLRGKQKPWQVYFGVSLLGISIHIAGDVITAYGTQIFAPLSNYKAAWPTTFVIDPWFTGIIVIGLLGCWYWRHSRLPAVIGLAILAVYVGFQGMLRAQALALGHEYARQQSLANIRVHALPQPLSPFNWKIVVAAPQKYYVSQVNLLRKQIPVPALPNSPFWVGLYTAYPPLTAMKWTQYQRYGNSNEESLARTVWQQEILQGYRQFAQLPTLYAIDRKAGRLCVWFVDLRFILPNLIPPFRYGGCRQAQDSGWELRQLPGTPGA
ncbi:metal-dependent hydrolase [Nitrosococcus oceani]|uniref:Membrane-bound metal-dependent hydrolase n=2 Tax=Nitrosococcus oceani TaxID=1229 RepID=Q3J7C8_NITOC|nr:metal-dependent hydrolase [Nitrosococcus oceani]KFI18296.1 hydrolase [Nitrosococcus oceani C-27]ABA59268.1 membrane-bound metal-dependent hydrolase [Nitrosococcus oceani ATCC 19707]EDZ66272.1 Predicted membrane-bound metal-dependent hydrolase family protein [Nitrosococcus oceani AFC27]KFI21474.1 hydrolase [Nitrosococcus oceani]GEM21093.1 hydrolase [Nitrosococcus oceani]